MNHTTTIHIKMAAAAFTKVYDTKLWGEHSGIGSTSVFTAPYREWLSNKMTKDWKPVDPSTGPLKFVDLCCGYYSWLDKVDVPDGTVEIQGFDVVESVIRDNVSRSPTFRHRVKFDVVDLFDEHSDLGRGDLYHIKDAIQHWPVSRIRSVVPRIIQNLPPKARLIVTNCEGTAGEWQEISLGEFQKLTLDDVMSLGGRESTVDEIFRWNGKLTVVFQRVPRGATELTAVGSA